MNQVKLLTGAIILLLISGLFFKSCSKSEDNSKCEFLGQVISYSADKCGCCPGWIVVAGSDTLKFETVPDNEHLRDLSNALGFPIQIKFSYKNSTGFCADTYKEMTCIEFFQEINCTQIGSVIGYDYTECLCCPGWFIKTENDTIKVSALPNENTMWNLVQKQGFPIAIMFDYEDAIGTCHELYKKVTCITLIN